MRRFACKITNSTNPMNSTNPNSTSTRPFVRRAPILAAAASLLLTPCLHAQTPAPAAKDAPAAAAPAPAKGATITPLVRRAEFEPDVIVFTATVSAGDTVPVQVEGQPKVFDLRVKEVSADQIKIELVDGTDAPAITLERGATHLDRVEGFDYAIACPPGDKATLTVRRVPCNSVIRTATKDGGDGANLYTIRFDGGKISALRWTLRKAFPKDNVVVNDPLEGTVLPSFELRNVRVAEIGRTLEFLSEGLLRVEVVENGNSGNIWRIGRKNPSEALASVKMRAVATPNLFANLAALEEVLKDAREMELMRLRTAVGLGAPGGDLRGASAVPLKSQGVFAIIGEEDGVAGLESLIKATEQRLAEAAAARVAAVAANAPKMRAVLAPRLFAEEPRWKEVSEELNVMQGKLAALDAEIRNANGPDAPRVAWATAEPRSEQKIFMLLGTETGIAGMESLIKAAEQRWAEKDQAYEDQVRRERAQEAERVERARAADIREQRAKEEAIRAQKEADLKAAEDRAKADKREQ